MPRTLIQRREVFRGGENLSVEPEKVQLPQFKSLRDWEIQKDWLPETSPGYALEFEIPRRVQLATMEEEETAWAGDSLFDPIPGAADTPTRRRFGLKARKHVHAAADTKTSTFTPAGGFPDMADMAADGIISFFFFHTTRANVTSIEIRFRQDATHYFTKTYVTGDLTAGDNQSTAPTQAMSGFTVVGAPALTWDDIVDMQVITVSAGATEVSFDDFFATSAAAPTEPITGKHSFERVGTPEKYLIVESGDTIYSRANAGTLTVRYGGRRRLAMEHFVTANDMVLAVNGQDVALRWDLRDDTFFRQMGVPLPPDTLVGATGGIVVGNTVAPGTYFAKVTFDMGRHGEGNSSGPTAAFTVAALDNTINYSAIPIGPPGTLRRIIYRTFRNSAGPFFLDKVVSDNTSTTISSGNADSLLGAELQTDGDRPPVLRLLAFAANTLFGVPIGLPSFIRYSDVTRAVNRTIEQWRVSNEMRLDPDDGDALTALVSHRGFIYAFKRFSCFLIDPNSTTPVARKISSVYGAISQRCVVDTGNALIFWSPRYGPVVVSGTEFRLLGDDIRSKEGPYPGVEDVSQGIVTLPTAGTTDERKFETQADWETGAFTNTTASIFPALLTYARAGTNWQIDDLARGRSVTSALSPSSSEFTQVTGPANAVDASVGDTGTAWGFRQTDLLVSNPTATLNLSMPSTPITHVEIKIRGAAPVCGWDSIEILAGASVVATIPASSPALGTGQIRNVSATFAARTNTSWKVRFTGNSTNSPPLSLDVVSVRFYEQGFNTTGEWESPSLDLLSAPSAWGIFNAQFESVVPGDVRFYMKSSTIPGGGTYVEVFPGVEPNVDLNRHIRFKIAFGPNDGRRTPKVIRIALSFTFSVSGSFTPTFDSSSAWFEDRYWFCPVRRGQVVPQGLWKLGKGGGWSEHGDYAMSTWVLHDGALMSGSSLDGKVFRNVRDLQGLKYTSREGRPIDAFLDTGSSPLSDQMIRKTILEYIVAARNEKAIGGEFLLNGSFEQIDFFSGASVAGPVPRSWDMVSPPGQAFGRRSVVVDSNFQPTADVYSGDRAMLIEGSSTTILPAFIAQSVYLRNSTNYVLRWAMKNRGIPGKLRIRASDGFILQSDGTWAATGDGIDLPDVGDSYVETSLAFLTEADIESRGPVEIRFWYPQSFVGGLMLIDLVSLREGAPVDGFLTIQPVLDGVPQEPEQVLSTFPPSGELAEERFPIDQAGVLNCAFRVRHRSASSSCKLFGILVSFGGERVRNDG